MRHRKAGKQLGRNPSHRKALLRNMVTSLLKYEQIETTDAKAKSIRPVIEKMITLAKRGDLHARRQALAYIQDKAVTHRLFDELKDRYLDRQGGYIRIIKKGNRKGDGAPISIIQLLPVDEGKEVSKKKPKKTGVSKAKSTKAKKEVSIKDDNKKVTKTADEKTSDTASDNVAVKEKKEEEVLQDKEDSKEKNNK